MYNRPNNGNYARTQNSLGCNIINLCIQLLRTHKRNVTNLKESMSHSLCMLLDCAYGEVRDSSFKITITQTRLALFSSVEDVL